nr:hypothetical protein CFP56_57028 [Quercus suber]
MLFERALVDDMGRKTRETIQSFFPPTPKTSPLKRQPVSPCEPSSSGISAGDGFSSSEIEEALKLRSREAWQPIIEYADRYIRDLRPGPGAMTFIGRVAGIHDTAYNPKTQQSAKGCVKLCVKDDTGAITNLVSNGEHGNLSSATAPLFASLFPERDRTCHLKIHDNSGDGEMCRKPLGLQKHEPLDGLMTLRNFAEGGCDVIGAKVVVVVKAVGAKKQSTLHDALPRTCLY